LRAAIPGCQSFREAEAGGYDVTLRVGLPFLKGTYSGHVELVDLRPHDSYRQLISAQGATGTMSGEATVTLHDAAGGTVLRYDAEIRGEGAIARFGGRLAMGPAKLLIGQCLNGLDREIALRSRRGLPS
jgi:carbon monoxide dehydrogenase subunit G